MQPIWAPNRAWNISTSPPPPQRLHCMPPLLRSLALVLLLRAASLIGAEAPHILIVVGPSSHPPGSHEVLASAKVMKHCLETMSNVPVAKVDLFQEWPKDPAVLAGAST